MKLCVFKVFRPSHLKIVRENIEGKSKKDTIDLGEKIQSGTKGGRSGTLSRDWMNFQSNVYTLRVEKGSETPTV